jgi:NAD(P)-dependent dehydrogenase (short-subunit alcohol dehydrogenase family)
MLLQNRVAIITGGGRGIGRAIAKRFILEGARVLIVQRDRTSGERTCADLVAIGGDVLLVCADVTSRLEMEGAVLQALSRWARIDILVNNAALMGANGSFLEMTPETWDQVIAVNLTGVFTCGQLVARVMAQKGGGVIVNVSSTNGRLPQPNCAAYAAAKGGLENLTRAMAIDLAPFHIRVNTVAPGPIQSRDPEDAAPRMTDTTLLGRWGLTREVASVVAFLASDEASYITGENILVDGGLLINSRKMFS